MSEPNDTPANAGTDPVAPDFQEHIDALAGILDDPDDPDTEEDKAHADDDADSEGADEVADDIDAKSEEDSDEKTEASKDEPQATGGRFVEHSARVKLPSGETTTVAELAKGYFRQSDYTRKSQENAEVRRSIDSERERVSQTAQQLQSQFDRMSAMLDQWKPQRPTDDPTENPIAWLSYQQQVEAWRDWQGTLETEGKQLREKQSAEMQQTFKDKASREHTALVQKFPAMSDPAKRQTFLNEAVKLFGAKYGFSPDEIGSIGDHRIILVIRDLMRADRLSAKAVEVKGAIKDKPKMVRGGRRGGDPSRDAKRARIERLRETGSRADGVRSLMDLDL